MRFAGDRPGRQVRSSALFALAALLVVALLVWITRNQTFINDEWSYLQERYSGGVESLLREYNSHLIALPILFYKLLFHTVGLHTHWPYVLVLALAHVGTIAAVFVLVRRRIGGAAALAVVAPLLLLGAAWEDLLWPNSLNPVLVMLGAAGMWLGLDRGDRAGEVIALGGGLVMVSSGAASLALLTGVILELVLARRVRSLWIAVVPAVVVGVWALAYGSSDVTFNSLVAAPSWAANAAAAAAGGYVGLTIDWGRVLLIAAITGAVLWCRRQPGRLSPRAWGLVASAIAFWLLTGMGRSLTVNPGTASRYVYVGAILLVLIAVELLRGGRASPVMLAGLCAFAVFALAAGANQLRVGNEALQSASDELRARVGAVELQAARVPAAYKVAPGLAPIVAGPYLAIVRRAGSSSADTPAELASAPASARAAADRVLEDVALSATAVPSSAAQCAPSSRLFEASAPAGGAVIVAGSPGTEVRLRRFSAAWPQPAAAVVPASGGLRIGFAPDHSSVPWRVRASGLGALRTCPTP